MFGLVPASIAAGCFAPLPALLALSVAPLAHLRPLDIAVIAIYFAMVLWIGFIMVAFDAEKRGLHDMICDTRVVRTRT